MGLLLYDIYKKGGTASAFRKAEIEGKNVSFYAHRKLDFDETLPWDHIDIGINKQFLFRSISGQWKAGLRQDALMKNAPSAKSAILNK